MFARGWEKDKYGGWNPVDFHTSKQFLESDNTCICKNAHDHPYDTCCNTCLNRKMCYMFLNYQWLYVWMVLGFIATIHGGAIFSTLTVGISIASTKTVGQLLIMAVDKASWVIGVTIVEVFAEWFCFFYNITNEPDGGVMGFAVIIVIILLVYQAYLHFRFGVYFNYKDRHYDRKRKGINNKDEW